MLEVTNSQSWQPWTWYSAWVAEMCSRRASCGKGISQWAHATCPSSCCCWWESSTRAILLVFLVGLLEKVILLWCGWESVGKEIFEADYEGKKVLENSPYPYQQLARDKTRRNF